MDKDVELYNQWRKTQSPLDMEKLLKQLDPLIQSEVNRRAGSLSRALLETQAKTLAVKAIKGFSPDKGAKLSTHVTNQLQKLSRVNYAHQKAARIPEHSVLQHKTYTFALEDFKTEHGRDPSAEELSDTLGWSPKKLEQFQTQFRPELLESKDSPTDMFVPYSHDPRIDYAYHSMSPRQQQIFEHTTGYLGRPVLSNTKLMQKLNITQGVLSYEKNKIKSLLEGLQ
jgi:hypothetical protein